jgi:hypothetical protein
VQLEGLGQLKNPMISSGIEPATIRVVILTAKTAGDGTKDSFGYYAYISSLFKYYVAEVFQRVVMRMRSDKCVLLVRITA